MASPRISRRASRNRRKAARKPKPVNVRGASGGGKTVNAPKGIW